MAEALNRAIKSSQEQAVASWITYLNQVRLDELIERLNQQDINLEEALKELDELKQFLGDPSHILGSEFTKHGEIAEHMQVNFENARRAIQGLAKKHTFEGVGRTAPEDYIRDGQQVQSKFYNGLKQTLFNHHGLAYHLETYPDFVQNGGAYDIPKDQYEKMVELLDKYKKSPSQLSTSDYNLAKKIDEFLKSKGLELGKDINPAVVDYKEVQQGVANDTVKKEEQNIKDEDEKQRKKDYDDSKPSLKEGAKAAGISAAVEGGITFCMSVAKKRKEKNFSDFTADDWKEIGLDTGKGTVKGGIRGGSIYVLTNFTATPANVASAYVTAAFGIASQVKALEEGRVSQEDFVINCETVCLDVTVSAIASVAGQIIIQIPVLGAVIGNVAGEFIYELCKKQGAAQSQKIIEGYNSEMAQLNQQLDIQYLQVVLEIQRALQRFDDLEKLAFDENSNVAFNGSIKLGLEVGVDESKLLKNMTQIDNYFLG
jgi:hypothetical protein